MKKLIMFLALVGLMFSSPALAQVRVQHGGTGTTANTAPAGAFLVGADAGGSFLEDVPSGTCDSASFLRFDAAGADGSQLSCVAGSGSTTWDNIGDAGGNGAILFAETVQTMDWDSAATAAAYDGLSITVNHDSTTDSLTQRLAVIERNATSGTATFETLLQINNNDTDGLVSNGIEITAAAGNMTTALNVSDAEIVTALAIGSNDITTGATTISSAELDRLDGLSGTIQTTGLTDLEGVTLADVANTEILIGTGAGTAAWAALSGDATMTNAGVVTVDPAGFIVINENLTFDFDGVDTTAVLANTPTGTPPNANLDISFAGYIVEQVASGPAADEFTISGATVTMGLAPAAGDNGHVTATYLF